MEMQYGTHISALQFLFVVCGAEERQHHAVRAQGRLDDIRDVFLFHLIVKVAHVLTGHILMLRQVVIRTVRNAPQLAPAKREQEFDIRRSFAVEAEFFRRMIAQTHLFFFHAQAEEPVAAETSPVLEPLQIRSRLAEEFQLHLLEFSGTEREVSRRNLVPERFPDLADAERYFLAGSPLYVLEIDKDTLCRLRAKVHRALCILRHALERLEHQVELADVRKVLLSAARAHNVMFVDIFLHLFLGPAVHRTLMLDAVFFHIVLDQLIRTETLMTAFAVHQRIGKTAQMSGRHPRLRVHQDRTVHAYIVGILLYKFLPPGSLNVVFQLHTQIAVVPGVSQTAVDLAARIYKPAVFSQSYDFLHCLFHESISSLFQ